MANPERGEVALVVKGDVERGESDREYTLKLSSNAAVTLQAKLKKTLGQLLAEARALDMQAIRWVLWLLLQKFHADEIKTVEQAGELMDDAGGVYVMFAKLAALATLNEPKKDDRKGDGVEDDAADPSTAQG